MRRRRLLSDAEASTSTEAATVEPEPAFVEDEVRERLSEGVEEEQEK